MKGFRKLLTLPRFRTVSFSPIRCSVVVCKYININAAGLGLLIHWNKSAPLKNWRLKRIKTFALIEISESSCDLFMRDFCTKIFTFRLHSVVPNTKSIPKNLLYYYTYYLHIIHIIIFIIHVVIYYIYSITIRVTCNEYFFRIFFSTIVGWSFLLSTLIKPVKIRA